MMSELKKALSGQEYDVRSQEVRDFQLKVKQLCHDYNRANPGSHEKTEILSQLVSGYNDQIYIEDGFHCLFGKNIYFEGVAMINHHCTILDSKPVFIGDRTMIGPGCQLICTNHALDPEERLAGLFHNKSIRLGKKVWLGANVTVLPGVSIGDGAVIGAGSVVTKDIPSGYLAYGNPCRIIRPITEDDKLIQG